MHWAINVWSMLYNQSTRLGLFEIERRNLKNEKKFLHLNCTTSRKYDITFFISIILFDITERRAIITFDQNLIKFKNDELSLKMPEAPLFYNVIFSTLIFGCVSPIKMASAKGCAKFSPFPGNEENNWIRLIDLALYGKIIKYGTRVEFLNTFTAAFTHKHTTNPPRHKILLPRLTSTNQHINSLVIVSFRVLACWCPFCNKCFRGGGAKDKSGHWDNLKSCIPEDTKMGA